MKNPLIELYTDGSCKSPGGPGGWAYILRIKETGSEMRNSGGDVATTNNKMELMPLIEGLQILPRPCDVIVYSDSQYLTKGLIEWLPDWKRNNWITSEKKPVKNVDLWQIIDGLKKIHNIKCHWVRGHNGHPENEECDKMAGIAAMSFSRK
jgi:ribonuclease HI